jgi:hypothetical protein
MRGLSILLITVSALTGCYNPKPDKISVNNDSLSGIIENNRQVMDGYREYLNEVSDILDSINRKQKNIVLKTRSGDKNVSVEEEINAEIEGINLLLEGNKNKIKSLNAKLKTLKTRNDTLSEVIIRLNRLLGEKEGDLLVLRSELKGYRPTIRNLQTNLAYLIVKNYVQGETINEETEMLHTAYYATGTENELKENNVIDKKGGFLGINPVTQLKTDFNANRFNKIDYYEFYNIPLNSKKAKMITNHPTNSYKWRKKGDTIVCLTITDPEEFWKASKYLVIIK